MAINGAVTGTAEPGFEPVRDAFQRNFAEFGDVGAAVTVYQDGRPVVDLWGGMADPATGRRWERDTVTPVYSATKGVVAAAAHLLVERGQLDLDAPVARYWPEFAAADKGEIPVRWLLSHQAGLTTLDRAVPLDAALRWDPIVEALAAQRPQWVPGTAHGYHGRTFGWLVGEVIRRITGHTPGRFVAQEIAGPLGIDFFIGLPETERARVARLIFSPEPEPGSVRTEDIPEELRPIFAAMQDPAYRNNRAFQVTDPAVPDLNSGEVQAAEIPSSNGIGTARGLARLYAALLGKVDGTRLLSPAILAEAIREQVDGIDRVMMVSTRYACGYMLPTVGMDFAGPESFAHPGRGGSLGLADPSRGLALAYVTNYMITGTPDMRAPNLVEAVNSAMS